jgi:hypothetical protein
MPEKEDLPRDLIGVEIFAPGKWQGQNMTKPLEFTKKFIEGVVANSQKIMGSQRFPVKLGHSNKQIFNQPDGQPALGWIDNVRMRGEKMIADLRDIPEVLMKAIKRGLFKQVSVEFGTTKDFGTHVKGLAILGADLPAVKTLKDLDQFFSDSEGPEGNVELCFSEPIINEEIKMEVDERTFQFEQKELELKKREMELTAKMEALEKRNLELEFSAKREEIIKQFKADVEAGKLMPHALKAIEKDLDEQKLNFSEGATLSFSMETVKAISEASQKLEEKEVVEQEEKQTYEFADDALEAKISDIMKTSSRSYDEASELAFSDPDIAAAYVKQANKEYKIEE